MSNLRGGIDDLAATAKTLDKGTDDLNAIGADFDPTEYLKSKEVREALRRMLNTLDGFRNDLTQETFSKAPRIFQEKIAQFFGSAKSIITEVSSNIQKRQGNQEPRRIEDRRFKEYADQIAKCESDLYESLKGMPTSELEAQKLADIAASVSSRMNQLNDLEKRLASSSKDAAAVITANKETVSLVESIAQHRASSVHWLIAFTVCIAVTLGIMICILKTASGGQAVEEHLKLATTYLSNQPPVDKDLVSRIITTNAITFFVAKVLFVSFAIGLCLITGRIYQTHTHNGIVCRQRLLANQLFVDLYRTLDAADQQGKVELIKQAAQAILAHTSTGFLHKGGNEMTPLTQVLMEAFKSSKGG